MAEHPRSNPHEAAAARAELERLRAARVIATPATAHVRIEGQWLLVTVPLDHYEWAKAVAIDAMGMIGRIEGDLAIWTTNPEDRDWLADALRCNGFEVTTGARLALDAPA